MGRGRSSSALLAIVSLVAAALPLSLVVASAAPAAAAPAPIKIQPIGDSITRGNHDGNPPGNEGGYRIALEDKLVAGGYNFDLVGTQTNGPGSLSDKNHDGHPGYTIDRIRNEIFSYLAKDPDVVLLMIGANDIGLDGTGTNTDTPIPDSHITNFISKLSALVNTILTNSDAKIIVAKITPWKIVSRADGNTKCPDTGPCISDYLKAKQDATRRYNDRIPSGLPSSSRIKTVDMFTNFSRTTWLDDDQHPNLTGYNQVASRWYPVLKNVLDSMPSTITPPGAPTNVSTTPGNGQVKINFSAPANNGGAPITQYRVDATPGGFNATGTGSPLTVTGLTNGTQYTFKLHAVNSAGAGTDATVTATPRTVPGVPTNVAATGGNQKATVTWSAPASTGGSPITGYDVFAFQGTTLKSTKSVAATPTSTDVGGLTNGTAYTFKVTAKNAAGSSAKSTASNAVTPSAGATVPGAPTGVSATAGNAEATVHWTPPTSNGGAAINAYIVYKGTGTTNPVAFTDANATQATAPNLTNGTAYQFTVRAQNSVGLGPASALSNSVTPTGAATEPGAPTIGTATAGDQQATVRWTPPANNGGSAITGFKITSNPATTTETAAANTTSFNFPGLTNNQVYTFKVRAVNSVGDSVDSAASNSVIPNPPPPPTVPDAPTIGTATAGNASATVRWTPPANNGGSAITGYEITSSPASTTTTQLATASATSLAFTGLTNNQAYTFTVTARNAQGPSNPSAASNSVTPTEPSATATNLGDLTPASTSSTRFWRNQGTSALPLKILSLEYPKGVQVDPGNVGTFTMTYTLPGVFSRFQSDIGIDANVCGAGGNVRFKVFKNGDLVNAIYDSGATAVTGKTTPTKKVDVDISGATSLTLRVEKLGTATCNYSDWADAKLVP